MFIFNSPSFRATTCAAILGSQGAACDDSAPRAGDGATVTYRTVDIDGVNIFYREAGPADAPTIVLLHGYPSSSHMFRDLMPRLGGRFHVIAPDYPGFGHSDMPTVEAFEYTFEHLSQVVDRLLEKLRLDRYSLYVMDYGAPIGFRIAARHPDRVQAFIVQNGNAYEEGLGEPFDVIRTYGENPTPEGKEALRRILTLDGTRSQYTTGVRDLTRLSPDAWVFDQSRLDRPGNQEIQLALFYDYRTNLQLYPSWHEYFREQQPPTLVVWGKNDGIFIEPGAEAYRRDLENVELHLLDTGHFALEDHAVEIARHIDHFLTRNLSGGD